MALQAQNYNYSNTLGLGNTLSIMAWANNYYAAKGGLKVISVTQPLAGTVTLAGGTGILITQNTLNEYGTQYFTYVIAYEDGSEPSTGTISYRTRILTTEFAIEDKTQLNFYPIVGTVFSETITTVNGTAPVVWTFSGLPDGISNINGYISGTPTVAGNFTASVSVVDAAGKTDSATIYFYVTETVSRPFIVGKPFADVAGQVGSSFSRIFTVEGGTAPHVWSISGRPPGLTSAANSISGSYTTAGIYATSVSVTDASGFSDSASITFRVAAVNAPFALSNDTATTNYQTAVTIDVLANDSGNVSIIGLTQPANGTTSVVSGRIVYTPKSGFYGTDTFTYTGSDGTSTAQATVTVTVNAPGVSDAPTITNAPAADVPLQIGATYSLDLEATGGVQPYKWAMVSQSGQTWLTINATTGEISGTFNPTNSVVGAMYGFQVTVTDSAVSPKSSTKTIVFVHEQSPYTATIQGTLRLDTSDGAFAARTVYLYNYTTGDKVAETTSDGTTGAWSFTQVAPGDYFVVGAAQGDDLNVPRDFDALGVITVV